MKPTWKIRGIGWWKLHKWWLSGHWMRFKRLVKKIVFPEAPKFPLTIYFRVIRTPDGSPMVYITEVHSVKGEKIDFARWLLREPPSYKMAEGVTLEATMKVIPEWWEISGTEYKPTAPEIPGESLGSGPTGIYRGGLI